MPKSVVTVDRRTFLRAAGVSIALPTLQSLPGLRAATAPAATAPVRMVCIGNSFGMYPKEFFPETTGAGYEMKSLMKPLEPHRSDFTVFSHLDHGVKGGHFSVHSFLSGVRAVDAKGMPDGNISIDQRAAEHVGAATRFPSLTIGAEDGLHGGCQMCWTRSGARIPPISGPRELFRKLFINGDEKSRSQMEDKFALQHSILDSVREDAKSLERRLGKRDRQKLDEYFTSVRDVESRLELDKKWSRVPKPEPDMAEPNNRGLVEDMPALYDLIALALQTDSTRIATLEISSDGFNSGALGVKGGYHSLSHHGHRPDKIRDLMKLELYQVEQFARFLEKLKTTSESDDSGTMLDNTMILFGSGMGDGNAHSNTDLPIIVAGGGFRHGTHRAYPKEARRRVPLCNLYLTMLQRFGVETDYFATSTGTLTGFETV